MGTEFPWLPISLMIGLFLGMVIFIPLAIVRFQRGVHLAEGRGLGRA